MERKTRRDRVEIDPVELRQLREDGATTEEIARHFKTTRYVVTKRCVEYGIVTGKGSMLLKPATRVCRECGAVFETRQKKKGFCSRTCQDRHFKRLRNDKKRTSSDNAESISLREVYERDGGVCHICGDITDWDDYTLDEDGNFIVGYRYPTRDHVVPLKMGGGHTLENVKLAHFWCNSASGARFEKVGFHDEHG